VGSSAADSEGFEAIVLNHEISTFKDLETFYVPRRIGPPISKQGILKNYKGDSKIKFNSFKYFQG